MIDVGNKKEHCCGCRSCEQSCPSKCIEMQEDLEGFLYPHVNMDLCTNCGACERACPCINEEKINYQKNQSTNNIQAFGGWNKKEDIRENSSSGGCFSGLAEKILNEGGTVFASVLKDKKVIVVSAETEEELSPMRGSKYVQSDTAHTYTEIKSLLESGRKILFVGTPCQVAGLYAFLGYKEYSNLFTVDFICHGVPSPKLFEDYLKSIEQKTGEKITAFKFRNKDKGWNQSGLQLGTFYELQNGNKYRNYPAFKDKYMNAFLDDVALRPSCYDCCFKCVPKIYADFTIADFWGVNKVNKSLNDRKGTSLIIVYTDKGRKIWDEISDSFLFESVDFEIATQHNPPLLKSAKKYTRRDSFFRDYINKGYDYVEKNYMSAFKWGTHKSISIIEKMLKRFEQFIKFGIVGISNTLINLAVYYVCLALGLNYLVAYTLGFLVSVCNAFYWNNKYVFKNKHETSIIKAFIKVFASYGFSFILSLLLMSLMVEIIGISSVIAPVLKLIITIPLNYLLNKVWAFKDKLEEEKK